MYRHTWQSVSDEQEVFGPATDLAFGLVGFLILLFLVASSYRGLELHELLERQQAFLLDFASGFSAIVVEENNVKSLIGNVNGSDASVRVWTNGAAQQTFSFGGSLLFESAKSELNEQTGGAEFLQVFVEALRPYFDVLDEIKIEGHADSLAYDSNCSCAVVSQYPNLELAARRSATIYELFVERGLDPHSTLISISSFGKFKPTDRASGEPYNKKMLRNANSTEESREKNRRVEITLVYSTT